MKKNIKNWLKENLSKERYLHSLGSEETAKKLALQFNTDVDQTTFAALVHDAAKCFTTDELLKMIDEYNIPITEMELKSSKTLHAPVGAYLVKQKFKVEDEDVLNAIRYHTIGRVNMSMLEKIVFLSDKIEENTRNLEFSTKIKKILDETNSVDEALIVCYEVTIKSLLDRRLFINTQTIEVYNSLLKATL